MADRKMASHIEYLSSVKLNTEHSMFQGVSLEEIMYQDN